MAASLLRTSDTEAIMDSLRALLKVTAKIADECRREGLDGSSFQRLRGLSSACREHDSEKARRSAETVHNCIRDRFDI